MMRSSGSAIEQFLSAMAARSIVASTDFAADGHIHRCPVDGAKRGRADASYVLHLDGVPAGGFENHRDGLGWQNWRADIGRGISADERDALRRRAAVASLERAADDRARHAEAQRRAERLFAGARPATSSHPYLRHKGVNAYGLRALREQLVIPLRDSDGVLWTLQFIDAQGNKRFLTGGRTRGCYFGIGRPGGTLCVTEGFCTAGSLPNGAYITYPEK